MIVAACIALSVLAPLPRQDGTPSAAPDLVREARQTIEKSLPFIEAKGVEWIRDRKCSSCHHVTFMVWSHRDARERGFAVDGKKVDEWTRWAVDFSLTTKSKEGQRGGGLDTVAQVILARRPYKADAPIDAADREFADILLGLQKPEGFWEAGGQLPSQRRPKEETNEATTRWVLLALQSLGPEDDARKAAREKATKWLDGRKPGQSNESIALAALMSKSEPLLRELLARQNEDGGWSWMNGEASDALATGQTLYVLSRMAPAVDPAPVRRAWGFLARTQRGDGSWKVRSTKEKSKDDSMSSYWGTAWAAIGLLRTLPE